MAAHEHNIDAAQRELDRRSAEGEDVSHLHVDQETGEILSAPDDETHGDGVLTQDAYNRAEVSPSDYAPQVWRETCTKCSGTGTWGGYGMNCFKCTGRGYNEYKTSPEQRAARKAPTNESRAKYQSDKERAAQRKWDSWAPQHEVEAAWILARIADKEGAAYGFARNMDGAVRRWGSLTDNQLAAVRKWIDAAERRAVQQFQAEQTAERVDPLNLNAVEVAFARATGQGIKHPKLHLEGFILSPAKATSQNAGAIYVKSDDSTYLGKVMRGVFTRSRDCDDALQAGVVAALADPMAAAIAYGKKFGKCAVCHRELSDPESIERGIGPVCATRMFGG
jgi:hypothetical protein